MSYNYEEISVNEVRDLLREWRENNERRSSDVVELWEAMLEDNLLKLGNEKHVVLEQVIFAAFDCHRFDVANTCIKILEGEFGTDSLRIIRYKSMRQEALGYFDEEMMFLDKLVPADETNAAPRKRRVAALKAQGLYTEAIAELVDYLKKFMSDAEAWQELCSLYMAVDYSKAVFCAEEMLLHQPHSHLQYQRVADIRYTMGGVENLELAKLYYCRTLKLNPDNMRALLGLYLTATSLAASYKSGGTAQKRKDAARLAQFALKSASARYSAAGAPNPTPVLESAMQVLSIN